MMSSPDCAVPTVRAVGRLVGLRSPHLRDARWPGEWLATLGSIVSDAVSGVSTSNQVHVLRNTNIAHSSEVKV